MELIKPTRVGIYNVRQELAVKPINPFPDDLAKLAGSPPRTDDRVVSRFYWTAAWAFVWAPLLPVTLFYVAEFAGPLRMLVSPLCLLSAFASPVILIAAIVVVLTSKMKSRWLFAPLMVGALLLEISVFWWMRSFSGIYK